MKKGHDARRPSPEKLRNRVGKARGGRPPDRWKRLCGRYVNRSDVLKAARRVLRDPKHPAWFGAFRWMAEQKYGKPTQKLEGNLGLTLEQLVGASMKTTRKKEKRHGRE
jgi:hypothetical protein